MITILHCYPIGLALLFPLTICDKASQWGRRLRRKSRRQKEPLSFVSGTFIFSCFCSLWQNFKHILIQFIQNNLKSYVFIIEINRINYMLCPYQAILYNILQYLKYQILLKVVQSRKIPEPLTCHIYICCHIYIYMYNIHIYIYIYIYIIYIYVCVCVCVTGTKFRLRKRQRDLDAFIVFGVPVWMPVDVQMNGDVSDAHAQWFSHWKIKADDHDIMKWCHNDISCHWGRDL